MRPGFLRIHDEIIGLINQLLPLGEGTQVFCNSPEPIASSLAWEAEQNRKKITVISNNKAAINMLRRAPESYMEIAEHDEFQVYNPSERFHFSIGIYNLDLDVHAEDYREKYLYPKIPDKMMHFKCTSPNDNTAPVQIMGIEQLLRSVIVGGYFATILPRRYAGRQRKYMRWFDNRAAKVAQIALPVGAVTWHEPSRRGHPTQGNAHFPFDSEQHIGKWELIIWTRPFLGDEEFHPKADKYQTMLEHTELRHTTFRFPLESLGFNSLQKCVKSFQNHDWYNLHVCIMKDIMQEHSSHEYVGKNFYAPHGLPSIDNHYFFNVPDDRKLSEIILKGVEDIKKVPRAIHIKIGNVTKVTAYGTAEKALLHEIKQEHGVGVGCKFGWDELIGRKPYPDVRETVLASIRNHGGVPCITSTDWNRLQKQDRWLDIQLAPIEREVPTEIVYDDEGKVKKVDWETINDDIGLRATYPDLWNLWSDRAESMNMRRVLYDFQFDDAIYMTIKQSILNGNVMGLGKTRTAAMVPQLRCADKVLIVCPRKLVDTWQEEIEKSIQPYARIQKINWQGKPITATVKTIEYASDLEEFAYYNIISYEKLKAIPADGLFYKCPVCGMVVFSVSGQPQRCPGNTAQPLYLRCNYKPLAWKEKCIQEDVTKHRVQISTGKKVHWSRHGLPETQTMVIDERVNKFGPCPEIPWMIAVEEIYKKMSHVVVGQRGDGSPIKKSKQRKPHVKWTFSELLRHSFNHIIVDEALYICNAESQRAQALTHLCGASRYPLTGTPMKSRADSMLNILNWMLKQPVFPDYRQYDGKAMQRWNRKYRTVVYIGGTETESGEIMGGKPKVLPKINNPELFQTEIGPFMRRHVRNEPLIEREIPHKELILQHQHIDMDDSHAAYYTKWLEVFGEWWQKMKEEEEDRLTNVGELLTKIGYLINASTIPHFMLQNILAGEDEEAKGWAKLIGQYRGPATAKMKMCWKLIEDAIALGDKFIVFSHRMKNSDIGNNWAEKKGYGSMVVDGRVSNDRKKGSTRSIRQLKIDQFRQYDYHVLWAGLGALAEGVNIPEANRSAFMDCSWVPADLRQANGRMLRPEQEKTVYSDILMHKGTIDEYVFAWCLLKDRAASEGIDHESFDDFSVDMIPDIAQYADSIVTGEAENLKRNMWLAIDRIKWKTKDKGGNNDS